MRDGSINGNHQVQTRGQGCGRRQIDQVRGEVDDVLPLPERLQVPRPRVLLQAHEFCIAVQEAGQHPKWNKTAIILRVVRTARPNKADPQLFMRAQTIFPGLHLPGSLLKNS
jgi:hypothetical protein